jgi:hypothetical protein
LEDVTPCHDSSYPSLYPLKPRIARTGIVNDSSLILGRVPSIDPGLLGPSKPEPFSVVVVRGPVFEVLQSSGVLSFGKGLAECDGDVVSREGRDGESYVRLGGLEDGIPHSVKLERDVCHDAQKTEMSCCRSEVGWV